MWLLTSINEINNLMLLHLHLKISGFKKNHDGSDAKHLSSEKMLSILMYSIVLSALQSTYMTYTVYL